jgi:hypothetical protein
MRLIAPAALCACLLAACAGSPPPIDALPAPGDHDWTAADAEAEELRVLAVEFDGVRGGEIAATMPAPAEKVVALLTAFEHAEGRRAWAERYTTVSRDDATVVARWEFEGKLGIDPTIELVFEIERRGDETVIRYRQLEGVFGLAAFLGDYRVRSRSGDPNRCLLIERVFIDSGLPFVGASDDEIAAGLREDIRRIRTWLREGPPVSFRPRPKPQEDLPSTL